MDEQRPRTPAGRTRLLKTSAVITTGIALAGVTGTIVATAAIVNSEAASSDDTNENEEGPSLPSFDIPGLGSSQSQQDDGGSNGS